MKSLIVFAWWIFLLASQVLQVVGFIVQSRKDTSAFLCQNGRDCSFVSSFGSSKRWNRMLSLRLESDRFEDGEIFFDDFAGQIIGSGGGERGTSAGGSGFSALKDRLNTLQEQELEKSGQLLRNWKTGSWRVRGFSLDSSEALSTQKFNDEEDGSVNSDDNIYVSCIVPAADDNLSWNNNGGNSSIWVGRTDGSVVCVELGNEYWASFRSQLTATASESSDDVVKIDSKLVRDDEASRQLRFDKGDVPEQSPFEILLQFSSGNTPVSVLLAEQSHLFTANEGSGHIHQWQLIEHEDGHVKVFYSNNLTEGHGENSDILCIKSVSLAGLDAPAVMFSAASDGSLALWDLELGRLLYRCQIPFETQQNMAEGAPKLLCADTDDVNAYVGTSHGQLIAYSLYDLLSRASKSGPVEASPRPNGLWQATTAGSVTALACGGPGSLGRGRGQPTSVLLTGDSKGTIKRWEVITRSTEGKEGDDRTVSLEQWPRLPTQRFPQSAHLFEGAHGREISALAAFDENRFVSASPDGIVQAWNPVSGKALFRMDGFSENIRSLCLLDGKLITDGMKNYVCIHDFDTGEEIPDDDEFFTFDE